MRGTDVGVARRQLLRLAATIGGGVSVTSLAAGVGGAQSDREGGRIRWSETYRRPEQYVECNAISAVDGGYYLVGETGFRSGTSHGWIQRVDEMGSPAWDVIDNRPGDEAPLHAVSTTADDGCVAVGDVLTHLTDEPDVTVLALDSEGGVDWASALARSWHISSSTLTPTADGYVIAAYARSYSTSGTRILVISIDDTGEQQWTRVLGEPEAINACLDIHPVDGGYLLAGSTDRAGDSHVLLVHIDEEGDINWEETYDIEGAYSIAHGVVPTDDGGYLLCGRTGSSSHIFRALVIKTDADGAEQWRWINETESACYDLVSRPAGGCAVAGRRLDNGWLAALDDDGELIASESYSDEGESAFESLLPTEEGYITAGRTSAFDSNSTRAWLLAVGRLAEAGADPIEPEYSITEQDDDSLPGFSGAGAVLGLSAACALAARVGKRATGSRTGDGREE